MKQITLSDHLAGIRRIAAEHGVVRLGVFGSMVRGDATSASDLDLLVDVESSRSLLDLEAFKQDVEALLGVSVDVVETGGLSPYLRDRVLAELKPL